MLVYVRIGGNMTQKKEDKVKSNTEPASKRENIEKN
jgi:hypothetical protein